MATSRPFTRLVARLAVALAVACAALGGPPARSAVAANLLVDRSDDAIVSACTGAANDCTLRGAISAANANGGTTDVITFSGSMTITLGSALALTANGTTIQATGGQVVNINANNAGNAFQISGSDTVLDGLRIYGSSAGNANVWITGSAQRVQIANNIIGDNDPGFLGLCGNSLNSHTGIYISSTAIPTSTNAVAWIYGNYLKCIQGSPGHGIEVAGSDHVVIGANAAGAAGFQQRNISLLNDGDGLRLSSGADNNTIRNSYWQYNNGSGIVIDSSSSNVVFGNLIQVNDLPGIVLTNTASFNQIGCPPGNANPNDTTLLNVIHQNNSHGIHLSGAATSDNLVLCNWIGLNDAGTAAAGNDGDGVRIDNGAHDNSVGASPGTRNVISGNTGSGVRLSGARNNAVQGNYIGTNVAGNAPVGNAQDGVTLTNGATTNSIGGTSLSHLNVIGGNVVFGVSIVGGTTATNTVKYNDIGLNSAATDVPLPNGGDGLSLQAGTHDNIIGAAGQANYMAFNQASGVYFAGGATQNRFEGNRVFSNDLYGILLDGSSTAFNLITGTVAYGNQLDGIAERNSANLNVWLHISTYGNGGLGVDKLVTSQSTNVPDGPFPTITGVNTALGIITGTASANAVVEVYAAAVDPSGYGEGQTYLASDISDGSGNWSVVVAPGVPACYTALEMAGFIIYASSEFGPTNCGQRVYAPLILR
jgi:parallel beta-helix repeat protein